MSFTSWSRFWNVWVIISCLMLTSSVFARVPRESIEWVKSYAYNATSREKLPRVLLVGDSICEGYSGAVCQELAGTAYVTYFATSKSVTDETYLDLLAFFLGEYDYDVIHFNNGLHCPRRERDKYESTLTAAIKLIKSRAPHAKIVWASSTPLKIAGPDANAVKELNSIAARVMAAENIPVNDLFALMDPLDRNTTWNDMFHFKPSAIRLQGKAVADCIRKLLGANKASPAEAERALKENVTDKGPEGKLDTTKH